MKTRYQRNGPKTPKAVVRLGIVLMLLGVALYLYLTSGIGGGLSKGGSAVILLLIGLGFGIFTVGTVRYLKALEVEAKSHIEMFHHYFFTLAPDDKYIKYTMEKAMYLVDETGLAQYNTLKEKGFYSNIMGTSAVFSIYCDSIRVDTKSMEFTYYGRQRIERRSSILMRELVTAGQLQRVPRTDNNPHGLLIVNWRTLINKDIEQKNKINY